MNFGNDEDIQVLEALCFSLFMDDLCYIKTNLEIYLRIL